jgi:predicted lipoprotein
MKAVSRASVDESKDLLNRATVEALAGNLEALRAIYKEAQSAKLSAEDLKKIADLAASLK